MHLHSWNTSSLSPEDQDDFKEGDVIYNVFPRSANPSWLVWAGNEDKYPPILLVLSSFHTPRALVVGEAALCVSVSPSPALTLNATKPRSLINPGRATRNRDHPRPAPWVSCPAGSMKFVHSERCWITPSLVCQTSKILTHLGRMDVQSLQRTPTHCNNTV
jgi:hypothetical protein